MVTQRLQEELTVKSAQQQRLLEQISHKRPVDESTIQQHDQPDRAVSGTSGLESENNHLRMQLDTYNSQNAELSSQLQLSHTAAGSAETLVRQLTRAATLQTVRAWSLLCSAQHTESLRHWITRARHMFVSTTALSNHEKQSATRAREMIEVRREAELELAEVRLAKEQLETLVSAHRQMMEQQAAQLHQTDSQRLAVEQQLQESCEQRQQLQGELRQLDQVSDLSSAISDMLWTHDACTKTAAV